MDIHLIAARCGNCGLYLSSTLRAHDNGRGYYYETVVVVCALGPSVAACLAIDASSVENEDEWSTRTAPDEIHLSFAYIRRP
jgi:hypothetical protein